MTKIKCKYEEGASAPLPFEVIGGEEVSYATLLHDGALLALTTYRLVLVHRGKLYSIPVASFEDIAKPVADNIVVLPCKDGKYFP